MLGSVFARIPGTGKSAVVFLTVAATVSALVAGAMSSRSLSAPTVYAGTVQIKLMANTSGTGEAGWGTDAPAAYDPGLLRTECEVIRSEVVLAQAVKALGSAPMEDKIGPGTQGKPGIPRGIAQLKKQIEAHPVPNTNMIAVSVVSENRDEAASFARAIGAAYVAYEEKLLKELPPPVSGVFKAEVIDQALTVRQPERFKAVLGVARETVGAILLGAVAGSVTVLVVFRRKCSSRSEVLPWLFMIVFFAVVGIGMVVDSAGLAVATAVALLLGFVVGGVGDWFVFLRRSHPEAPDVFPAVFMIVFILVVGWGVISWVLSSEWYASTARLRLRMATPGGETPGTASAGSPIYDPQLVTAECDVILAESNLQGVVKELNLTNEWGNRYNGGGPLQTSWALGALKRRTAVHRIPGTALIEISTQSEKAEEAARLAELLAERYRDRVGVHRVSSRQKPIVIQPEVVDTGVPGTDPAPKYVCLQLISCVFWGLSLAFAAGGGAVWVVSWLVKARGRRLLT